MDRGDEERTEQRGWFARLHLSWPMLFLAGWLLYEFTAQPGLAALVACAKFGWGDVRTAFWLRRVDPNRWRGQTCFWAYLTYGLWKVALLATLMMIVVGLLHDVLNLARRQPGPNNDLAQALGGVLAAAVVGFGLSFPTTYIALWSARRNGVRIWLGQAPNRARKERFWPPYHGGINAAPFVCTTCLLLTLSFLVVVDIFLAVMILPGGFGAMVCWMTMQPAILLLMAFLSRDLMQVIARSPQECWAVEEAEAVYQVHDTEEEMSEA